MKRFSILLTLLVGVTIGYIAACSNTKPESDANAAADAREEGATTSDSEAADNQPASDGNDVTAEPADQDQLAQVPEVQPVSNGKIVHDAEYYILEAQNGANWAAEDEKLNARLAELREKHGRLPNIVHIMWDDTPYGDVGIPAIQKVRGLHTPNLNKMAREGILFTRMYTEVGCTPSRAACMTGRHPVRNAMYNIGMLREMHGLHGTEVTLAEVGCSHAGSAA